MKDNKKYKKPLIDFLEYFIHIHVINSIFENSIEFYEKRLENSIKSGKLLQKVRPENNYPTEEEVNEKNKETIIAVKKEIDEDYFSIKSAELILLYSRFESAITEVIYLYFRACKYSKIPNINNIKYNINDFLMLSKKDQKIFVADLYILQNTTNIRYGFNRFESILKPIFGESKVEKNIKKEIFKFAQIRNLLIHKNGVVDKNFKSLFKDTKQRIGNKINISNSIMENCIRSVIDYTEDIMKRIDEKHI